ncbi:Zinc metalloproteinase nas-38 [Trichinella pseudospiralis]|uniref:Metalloendopeptidase n=1 Tax=Trichinella pseudospiralis TaxID=6337 RepID=A0A0V1JFK0_TRIPS|nr:Zinc metalloproteinase nas-38 [Trichinella pseudospiralis]
MRVLICHPEFWFGGAESVVFDAIQAFNSRNYSVYLVTGHCDSYWLDKLKNSVTAHYVNRCFPWISNRICSVHYPAIPIVTTQCSNAAKYEYCETLPTNYFLSLNRYWPEKRVDIAIEAFTGSVEERIDASVNCRNELIKLAKLKNIEDKVIFLQNVSSEEKVQLLSRCIGVQRVVEPMKLWKMGKLEYWLTLELKIFLMPWLRTIERELLTETGSYGYGTNDPKRALESGRFIGAGSERRKDLFEQSDKLIQWCQQMTASNFADCERELKNWCYDLGNKVKLRNLPDVCLPLFRTDTDDIAQPTSGKIFNNFYSNKPKSVYTEAVTKEQIRELKAAFSAIELNSFGERFQNDSMKMLKPIFDTQKNIRRSSNSFATAANELDVNNLKTLFMGDLKLTNNQWKALMEEAKTLQRSTDEQVYRDLRSSKNAQRPIIEKWHTNHILYRVEVSLKDASRDAILRALQRWQESTCIRFEEHNQLEPNVALINFVDDSQSDSGCSSFVGRVGGIQNISIVWPRCSSEGIVSHQIGHALGLLHEHSRPDRDEHIIINYEQTVSEHRDVVSRLSSRVFEHFRSMYDPGSVMHMPPTVKNLMTNADELTMLAIDPNYQSTFGQRISPSFLDYKLINMMYCNNKCSTKLNCLHGGYVDVNDCSRCTCPTGFEGPLCENVDSGGDHCGGELISSDQPMLVQSPSYPESFQPYQECYWLLKAPSNNQKVALEFVDVFDFPCEEVCSDSYVELNAGPNFDQTGYRFCCNTQPPSKIYYSNGSEMLIIFKAGTKTANGFRVRYWTAPKEEKITPAPEVIIDNCPCEQWSEWSPCSQNCGGCGNTVRQRICHSGIGLSCPATQSRLCNLDQCVGSKVILNNGEFHILFNGCCVGLFPDDEGHCQQPGDIASILGSLIPINMG